MLEKKFNAYIGDTEDIISEEGEFSHVHKVYNGKREKVYCGKFPKEAYEIAENGLMPGDKEYLEMFQANMEYGYFIALKLREIGLAPKPQGAYDVRINESDGIYLPAFVNEFDSEMTDLCEAKKLYGEKFIENLKNEAFKKILKEGFEFFEDAYTNDLNAIYSEKKGIQAIDYDQWGYRGIISPFPKNERMDQVEIDLFKKKIKEDTLDLKTRLFN